MLFEKPIIVQCQGLWLALNGGEVPATGGSYEEVMNTSLIN